MKMLLKPLVPAVMALALLPSCTRSISWEKLVVDGSLTGTTYCNADNVALTLGVMDGDAYMAPNGRRFTGGATPEVASRMIAAQERMAPLKQVIGTASQDLDAHRPESELSNMLADEIMRATAELTGRHVDMGLANFGGIRTSIPKGDILMDDIVSMFPFKNYLAYVSLKGSDLRRLLEDMAGKPQAIAGARMVISGGKVKSIEVGGKPLDDNRIYGLATIDFLLDGGDRIFAARNARELILTDHMIIDVMLPYVKSFAARGESVEYHLDGRVTIED